MRFFILTILGICAVAGLMIVAGCTTLKNETILPDGTKISTFYNYPMWTAKSHSLEYDKTTGKFTGRFESSATSMVDSLNAMSGLAEKVAEGAAKGAK